MGYEDLERNAAFAKSWGCVECDGHGLTSRYVESVRPDGEVIVTSAGCICHLCDMGRWVAKHYPNNDGPLDLMRYPNYQPWILKFHPDDRADIETSQFSPAFLKHFERVKQRKNQPAASPKQPVRMFQPQPV